MVEGPLPPEPLSALRVCRYRFLVYFLQVRVALIARSNPAVPSDSSTIRPTRGKELAASGNLAATLVGGSGKTSAISILLLYGLPGLQRCTPSSPHLSVPLGSERLGGIGRRRIRHGRNRLLVCLGQLHAHIQTRGRRSPRGRTIPSLPQEILPPARQS